MSLTAQLILTFVGAVVAVVVMLGVIFMSQPHYNYCTNIDSGTAYVCSND